MQVFAALTAPSHKLSFVPSRTASATAFHSRVFRAFWGDRFGQDLLHRRELSLRMSSRRLLKIHVAPSSVESATRVRAHNVLAEQSLRLSTSSTPGLVSASQAWTVVFLVRRKRRSFIGLDSVKVLERLWFQAEGLVVQRGFRNSRPGRRRESHVCAARTWLLEWSLGLMERPWTDGMEPRTDGASSIRKSERLRTLD